MLALSKTIESADQRRLALSRQIHERRRGKPGQASDAPEPFYSDQDLTELAALISVDVSLLQPHRAAADYAAHMALDFKAAQVSEEQAKRASRWLKTLENACQAISPTAASQSACLKVLEALDTDIETAMDGPGSGPLTAAAAWALMLSALAMAIEDETKASGEDNLRAMLTAFADAAVSNATPPADIALTAQRLGRAAAGAGRYIKASRQEPEANMRLALRKMQSGHDADLARELIASEWLRIYSEVKKRPTLTSTECQPRLTGECLPFVQRALRPLEYSITPDQVNRLLRLGRT
jgi:hypothetical protein